MYQVENISTSILSLFHLVIKVNFIVEYLMLLRRVKPELEPVQVCEHAHDLNIN